MQHQQSPRHLITWSEHGIDKAFRRIPAGSFRMGSRGIDSVEEPAHVVEISQDFWLAETPVTQAQFAIWTQAENIEHENHFDGRATHPAENMDWHQAGDYCQWLSRTKSREFPAGFPVAALPSEAQWEYACRAGTDTEYYTGDGEHALSQAAWYDEDWESGSTHPVGTKQPNDFMLYDMHGNVWEWCRDAWDETAYRRRPDGVLDPECFDEDKNRLRVLRGGSWINSAVWCRAACRNRYPADFRAGFNGFRVCLVRSLAARQEMQSGAEKERES